MIVLSLFLFVGHFLTPEESLLLMIHTLAVYSMYIFPIRSMLRICIRLFLGSYFIVFSNYFCAKQYTRRIYQIPEFITIIYFIIYL